MSGRWLAALLVGAVAIVFGVPACWVRARSRNRIRTVETVPDTEVALVLGAGVRRDGYPSRILQGRLETARALFVAGKVTRIVVSGSPESRGYSEPVVMRDHLVRLGVPRSAILLDEAGINTWRSCLSGVSEFGFREVTVVTTDFHLPRAVALCHRAGIDAHGVGHDAVSDGLRRVSRRGARREIIALLKAFWWRW